MRIAVNSIAHTVYLHFEPPKTLNDRILGGLKIIMIQVSQVSPTRPERAEAPSPGHRPGYLWTQTCRPVRAKALYIARYLKAFALTGRLADCHYTQGDALG